MRHFYRTSDRMICRWLIMTIIMLMVAALHNLRDARAQSSQLPILPRLDDATVSRLRAIFADGQAKGNRADVFAKVGDSITESQSFLSGFGCGEETFDDNTLHLAAIIDYFKQTTFPANYTSSWCEIANSFTRDSLAASTGWSADYVLNVLDPPSRACPPPYHTMLRCELHVLKPAFVLIMYGTNDLERYNNLAMFRENITEIINQSIGEGVIPILYTIPPRIDQRQLEDRVAAYNALIINAANENHIPLINYWTAMTAPSMVNEGLSEDGIHPNLYGNCAPDCLAFDLTPAGLHYGYNQRNLITLETLEMLKAKIIDNTAESSSTSQADRIVVSQTGQDSDTCGAAESPCQTIKQGIGRAESGQTVLVQPGTYAESWLELKSGIALRSTDGIDQTKIYSGAYSAVRFDGIQDATLDGFEIYGDWNAGDPGDGLVRVLNASNITIRNSVIHDAPFDQDVIKVSGKVHGLLIENVVAYNPGQRELHDEQCQNTICYQEVIDLYGSDAQPGDPPPLSDVIVRGCWLFHTPQVGGDWLIYTKINAENILYENNVFGPSAGLGAGNAAVGIGTSESGQPDASAYVVQHAIVRGNVFIGLKGDAAFAVMNANDVWLYNNLFYANSSDDLRSVIMFRGNTHPVGKVVVEGNSFLANDLYSKDSKFYWVRDSAPQPFEHRRNLYWNNIGVTDIEYRDEEEAIFATGIELHPDAMPDMTTPRLSQVQKIREIYAAVFNAETDITSRTDFPNWKLGVTDR